MRLAQRVDRRLDEYHKVVFDPSTGEVVYEKKEPLSEHRGRGDDRLSSC